MTENNNTDSEEPTERSEVTRRRVLASAAAIAAAGAAGYVTGSGSARAQATPSGQIGTLSDPLTVAYVDRVAFHPRTSDPSSPPDGMAWYNSEA